MRKFCLIGLFLMLVGLTFAQSAAKADALFQDGKYAEAQIEYKHLLKRYPTSALYLYRYARCTQELGDYPTALVYFEKAGNRYDLKHFYVGEICMHLFYFDRAIDSYNRYLTTIDSSSPRVPYIRSQIQKAEKLQRYLRRVEKVEIIDSVETTLDSILAYCPLSLEAGRINLDSAQHVVYTNQRGDRKLWGAHHDSIQVLVSSHKLIEQWSTPDTLPREVNMSACQAYPYMLSDGVTLYFSACDPNGLGGYDIYITRYNTHTEAYTVPENLGMPFNSTANDYMMLIDEHKNIGYFATDRFSTEGKVRIYSFVPKQQKSFWRDIPQDSLIAYAQLRHIVPAQNTITTEHQEQETTSAINKEDKFGNTIFFVLNDSVVYTSLDDFQNPTAKSNFQEWQTIQQQIDKDAQYLSILRQQYSEADENERKQIAPTILQLENQQSQSTEQSAQLIRMIRKAEISYLQ